MSHVASGVQGVKNFISARPGDAENWLNPPPPDPPDPPDVGAVKPVQVFAPAFTFKAATLAITRVRASRNSVRVRVKPSGAGKLRLRGTARLGGSMHTACTAKATVAGAGELSLRCPLRNAARRRLHAGSLRLRLRAWFAPDTGVPVDAVTRLSLPPVAAP